MTDERWEIELRTMLTSRAPATVSPRLRALVLDVPAVATPRTGMGARLGTAWRGVASTLLVGAAVVAILATLATSRLGPPPSPGPIGAPSSVPGIPSVPHVVAPEGLFTAGAMAESERRLDDLRRSTGLEARFVVVSIDDPATLVPPDGWPEAFDTDGRPERDIVAVVGRAPDGRLACCLTLVGADIERIQGESVWQPMTQPGALDSDLASTTSATRDAALARFTRGVEDLGLVLDATLADADGRAVFRSFWLGGLFVLPLLVLAAVLAWRLRRRPSVADAQSLAGQGPSLVPETAVGHEVTAPGGITDRDSSGATADVAAVRAAHGPAVPWSSARPTSWSDGAVLAAIGIGLIALAAIALGDGWLPASTAVRVDATLPTIGLRSPTLPIVPGALVALVAVLAGGYALRGGRWRRAVVVVLAGALAWGTWAVIGSAVPELPGSDRGWVADDAISVTRQDGAIIDQAVVAQDPGETFTLTTTVRNPGLVPITLLGLDAPSPTTGNPSVASIVGLGWVVQPGGDGRVTTLSARPADASASWPLTIPPGGSAALLVVGRTGACAEADGAVTDPLLGFDLTFRALGVERSAEIGLPVVLLVSARTPCTVAIPGGTITYGNETP